MLINSIYWLQYFSEGKYVIFKPKRPENWLTVDMEFDIEVMG
jgi:hypothetical protein